MTSVFERIEEVRIIEEKANQSKADLRNFLLQSLIELSYKMQEVKLLYNGKPYNYNAYYPILDVPEGLKKEEETFCINNNKKIIHEYILEDEKGKKIRIVECAEYTRSRNNISVGSIFFNFFIIENIIYCIYAGGYEYKHKVSFDEDETIKAIIDMDEKATINDSDIGIRHKYEVAEKEYEKFFNKLNKERKYTTLKEIVANNQIQMEISDTITANIEINTDVEGGYLILRDPKFQIWLNADKCVTNITIKPYLYGDVSLEKQSYKYEEMPLRKEITEMTLREAIQLLKNSK